MRLRKPVHSHPAATVIYIKSFLVGIVGAVLGAVLWVLAEIGILSLMVARQIAGEARSGGIGAVSMPGTSPLGALLGFVIGFFWALGRGRKARADR